MSDKSEFEAKIRGYTTRQESVDTFLDAYINRCDQLEAQLAAKSKALEVAKSGLKELVDDYLDPEFMSYDFTKDLIAKIEQIENGL